MKLGAFSLNLTVKNIKNSKAFYETLGFEAFAGELEQNWLIMKNGDHCIGLFQGMFDSNIMTFNPGWDKDCNQLESFTDVRELYKRIRQQGIKMTSESVSGEAGPSSFTITDPDGNSILFDQHV